MAEPNGLDSTINKWILAFALSVSAGSSGLSIYRAQDQLTDKDAAHIESRIDAAEAATSRLQQRIDAHREGHPDKEIQRQIYEIKLEMAKMRK